MPVGAQPPLLLKTMPPPATPQPEPRTGDAPGERHGLRIVQSLVQPAAAEQLTLFVRYWEGSGAGCGGQGVSGKESQAPWKCVCACACK